MTITRFILVTSVFALSFGSPVVLAESPQVEPSKSTLAQASPRHYAQRPDKKRGADMMEQLDLSDQQKQQLTDIRQKYQQKIDPKQQQVKTSRQELNQMLASNASDRSIRSKHQEIMQLHEEISNLRLESMLEVRGILTLDQRREFAQLMEKRRDSHRRRLNNAPNSSTDEPNDLMP